MRRGLLAGNSKANVSKVMSTKPTVATFGGDLQILERMTQMIYFVPVLDETGSGRPQNS